jgi:hypothetical protein
VGLAGSKYSKPTISPKLSALEGSKCESGGVKAQRHLPLVISTLGGGQNSTEGGKSYF